MVAMSIFKKVDIKSKIRNYSLLFVDDFMDGWDVLADKKLFLFIDKNVAKLYKNKLQGLLNDHPYLLVEATEKNKTFQNIDLLIKQLIDRKVRKNYVLVAIGGGIIQDIVGFIASILYRGIEWVFFPTTLLSQCDSCLGSKTSVNIDGYKNQVGNFYPPSQICIDTNFLETLSIDGIKSGIGEMLHFYFIAASLRIQDISENYEMLIKKRCLLKDYIEESLKIKKFVVESDEFDKGERNLFNYGHTFGHALESITNYILPHGQAVTIGMDISNYLSEKLGLIDKKLYLEMKKVLLKNWPEYNFSNVDLDSFFEYLQKDKKNINNEVTAILTEGPGKMLKRSFALTPDIRNTICLYFEQYDKDFTRLHSLM